MFPYQYSDDHNGQDDHDGRPSLIFFPPPSSPPLLLLQDDLITFHTPPPTTTPLLLPPLPPHQNVAVAAEDINFAAGGSGKVTAAGSKNVVHREVERQRRKDMATLNASLRDLLPLRYVKGKRAASDQMQAAVEYIRELQTRVGAMGKKRDELKNGVTSASYITAATRADDQAAAGSSSGTSNGNGGTSSVVLVRPCLIGVEVAVNIGGREDDGRRRRRGLQLSRIVELLMERGLDVVTCDTVRVNDTLIHTLQSQVKEHSSCIDVAELQRLLTKAIL